MKPLQKMIRDGLSAGAKQRVEGLVYREAPLAPTETKVVNEEERIVEISFASEFPVVRDAWWEAPWVEVLGISEQEADLSRLNARASVLYNHSRSRDDRLGAVLRAWVDKASKVLRAEVQFSKRAGVDDVWGDVRDGLLPNVSVGYFILERTLTRAAEAKGEPDEYRVTNWQPFEISFVDVPADPTVGLGRGLTPGQTYRVIDLPGGRKNMDPKSKRGAALAAALNGLIDAKVGEDKDRDAVIAEAETAAGLEAGTLAKMTDEAGDSSPTRKTLEALATALGGEASALVAAAETDGALAADDEGGEDAGEEGEEAAGDGGAPPNDEDAGRSAGNPRPKETPTMKTPQEVRAAESKRQREIRGALTLARGRIDQKTLDTLERELLDEDVTVEAAKARILDVIGRTGAPVGDDRSTGAGEDQRDKAIRGITDAIILRGRVGTDEQLRKIDMNGNQFRGASMVDIAKHFLTMRGISFAGMDKMEIVGRALTTTDFPDLLSNISGKSMMLGYEEAPETWRPWCRIGNLSDFKQTKRVGMGEFPALQLVTEAGEYKYGKVSDFAEPIQLGTYGRLCRITRQAMINDDLSALTDLPRKAGRAAARLPGDLAYGVLTANAALSDGVALFHTTHGNLLTGSEDGVPSVAQVSKMRRYMAVQKDVDDNATALNIRLGFLLCPVALGDTMRTIIASEKDTDTAGSLKNNPVRNIATVIDDARLDADSANKYYGVAGAGYDTVEVAFLDGQERPTIEQVQEPTMDAVTLKVRLDVAAAAMEFRTMIRNDGQ